MAGVILVILVCQVMPVTIFHPDFPALLPLLFALLAALAADFLFQPIETMEVSSMTSKRLFNSNFTFLILGQISSLVGNYTLKFALSMYILEQTGSATLFASLLAAAMVPTILISPFGGILADRADRRMVMVGLDACSGAAVLMAALALPKGHDIAVIAVLLVVLSILAAFESPTVQACVPQMLPEERVLQGNAVVNQVSAIASMVTPFLGSLFYTAFGIQPVFYAAVACFFLTALLECMLHLPPVASEHHLGLRAILQDDFAATLRFLRREQPAIVKLLLLAALASFFVAGTVVVGFPYLVRTVLGLSASHYGAAESAMGVAAILGGLLVGLLAQKFRPRHLTAVFLLLGLCLLPAGAAFLAPLSSWSRYLVLMAAFCVCQMGCSIFSTYSITLIQARTPAQLMGKVMSCVFTLSMCAQPLGQLIYGALFDRFAACVYWVLIPSGLILCVIGCGSAGFFARLRENQTGPVE